MCSGVFPAANHKKLAFGFSLVAEIGSRHRRAPAWPAVGQKSKAGTSARDFLVKTVKRCIHVREKMLPADASQSPRKWLFQFGDHAFTATKGPAAGRQGGAPCIHSGTGTAPRFGKNVGARSEAARPAPRFPEGATFADGRRPQIIGSRISHRRDTAPCRAIRSRLAG